MLSHNKDHLYHDNYHNDKADNYIYYYNYNNDKADNYIYYDNYHNDKEIQELLGIKATRTYTLVKKMQEAGLINVSGRGKNKKYVSN